MRLRYVQSGPRPRPLRSGLSAVSPLYERNVCIPASTGHTTWIWSVAIVVDGGELDG